jgi:hypothetical protein
MIEKQTIYAFQSGGTAYYGYTPDPTGANLPTVPAGKWEKHGLPIQVEPGEGPRAGMDVENVQAEIRRVGYCVKEGVVTVTTVQRNV